MFYTMARGVEVYRRYLVVAAVLISAAIVGGLILRWSYDSLQRKSRSDTHLRPLDA